MDAATFEMVLTAYDETVRDARGQGQGEDVAHREGITAAAMCLAAMTGIQDAAARAEVEGLDLAKQLAA
jgi:hypothetical protein